MVPYNKNAKVSYMDIEERFKIDDEVHPDDLHLMCQGLYQHELLAVFGLQDEEPVNYTALSTRISTLYALVKQEKEVVELVDRYFFQDEETTFLTLFSYEMFHQIHKIIIMLL
jgi:hypothetical protein